ncbi:MAG TPA: outer membrane beta-barrel protein [Steroidobacteraceae bacterium]|nr:outer membrane beta-barrel protein [Steroidobacteraceae bacterium]
MRKKNGITLAAATVLMLSSGAGWADQAAPAAPPKPAIPSITDILMSSGITASGYVDATFSAFGYSGSQLVNGVEVSHPGGYDTFNFQQAGLTLAYQPSAGFGALINPVVTSYNSIYAENYAPDSNYYLHTAGSGPGAPAFAIYQGYAQYVTGAWSVIAGKFATLAGAEVYAPPGNANVTRSLLFTFEPLTHTGVRATYAPSSKFSFIIGANNGWFDSGDESSFGAPKTLEVGIALNPTKTLAWTLQDYFGSDYIPLYGTHADIELFDTVLTWTITSQLILVGSVDYGDVASLGAIPSANWWGVAGYVNYQFNPKWRLSLRGEYLDDADGFLTDAAAVGGVGSPLPAPGEEALKEVTLTFGWDPVSHLELRIEGRYDDPDSVMPKPAGRSVDVYPKTEQGWLEALWKF